MDKQAIGVIGLAVMGRNLALNIESRGYTVSIYNRTRERTDALITAFPDRKLVPAYTLQAFAASLETPRRILLMVKAGAPTNNTIAALKPLPDRAGVLIDGGNTHFTDTMRRHRELADAGLHFIGTGVSGGEEGALHGSSIMLICCSRPISAMSPRNIRRRCARSWLRLCKPACRCRHSRQRSRILTRTAPKPCQRT